MRYQLYTISGIQLVNFSCEERSEIHEKNVSFADPDEHVLVLQ